MGNSKELINLAMAEADPAKKKAFLDQGIGQLQEALKIHPHFADALFKLGVAYHTVAVDYDRAVFYYKRAMKDAPAAAIIYSNLGAVYEILGKQEFASYYYNKAVEVNPSFEDGVENRDMHRKKTGLDVHVPLGPE